MSPCNHSQWLDLDVDHPNWSIIDPDRLTSIRNELPDPNRQKPTLVFFLGKLRKSSAIRKMFTQSDITKKKPHGIANLYIDRATAVSDHPLIVADCTIGASTSHPADLWKGCHTHRRLSVSHCEDGDRISRNTIVGRLLARLLFPLAHIVCLFAADFGGNAACGAYIATLMRIGARNALSVLATAPELIIISEEPASVDIFIQLECEPAFGDLFGGLTVITIRLRETENGPVQGLQQVLQAITAEVLDARATQSQLFSASDLGRLFLYGLTKFAERPLKPFDIFSSIDHPVKELLESTVTYHIGEFLRQAQSLKLSINAVSGFIVTAIFAQSYPQGTHGFAPDVVYNCNFAHIIAPTSKLPCLDRALARRIKSDFHALFLQLDGSTSALSIRQQYLQSLRTVFTDLNSATTCWVCLVRPPEFMLHYGHGLCARCVEQYGTRSSQAHSYDLTQCPICGNSCQTTIKLKPWTVEPNVLAIDGGGVRGVVALSLIKKLTAALGSTVGEYFDYAAGTSAGGLIILDLVVAGTVVDASLERFTQLASKIFPAKMYSNFAVPQMLMDYVRWWLSDNKYDSEVLEAVVQDVFGTHQRLFDSHATSAQSMRIGIMATTTAASELRIFCNYNGEARAKQHAGYAILRGNGPKEEPYLWEVARCTAAAPSFFRPKRLKGFGWLQDGGMRANNPSAAARSELRCIWPRTPKPHVVVSIGTGYSAVGSPEHERDRGILWDGFIPRTMRGFLASPSVDGESGWTDLLQNLSDAEKGRHFRISHRFINTPPSLDDASAIPSLIETVGREPLESGEIVRCLWTSRFFMELQAEPTYVRGQFHCVASILFRGVDARPLIQVMNHQYSPLRLMIDNRLLAHLEVGEGVCVRCGHFQQNFTFAVRYLSDNLRLTLAYGSRHEGHLPGSGKSVNWFIEQQTFQGRLKHWPTEAHKCDRVRKRTSSTNSDGRCPKRRK